MLSVKNLKASVHKNPLLRGIDMEVKQGELHLILGVNGSGKSTFGKVLLGSGQYVQTAGEILFEGEDISSMETFERAQKGIFLSHQSPPSLDGVSAKDVLRAGDKARETKRSVVQFKKVLKESFLTAGLSSAFVNRSLNDGASGGERKKMEIASLLTLGAKLAFLDEIDSGLDVDALKSISEGINKFLAQDNTSVILVSHSEGILKYLNPSHVHVFCGGRVIASGGAEIAKKVHEEGYSGFMDCKECINEK